MRKLRLKSFIALSFATFLALATLEVFAKEPDSVAVSAAETANGALEVPLTGNVETRHTAETYESLIEIAFLALTGIMLYVITSRRESKK